MATNEPIGNIDWENVKTSLPATAHEFLESIRTACEARPGDMATAVRQTIRTDLARMRARFDELRGEDQ